MTFTGTLANINTALNGLSFAPTANYNGAASLQIVTNDQGNTGSGGALTDTDTVNITVIAVNDAPVNSVPVRRASTKIRHSCSPRPAVTRSRSATWTPATALCR